MTECHTKNLMRDTVVRPDRVRAMILAGAVGDALGANIEFDRLPELARHVDRATLRHTYPTGAYPPGAITDDTQMTLFTAEAMIRARDGHNTDFAHEIAPAYLRWYGTQHGGTQTAGAGLCAHAELYAARAPGATCMGSLSHPSRLGNLHTRTNDSKGCGTIMRVAPTALNPEPGYAGAVSAAITHGHPDSIAAAAAQATLLALLIRGVPLRKAIANLLDDLETAVTDPGIFGLNAWAATGFGNVHEIVARALILAELEDEPADHIIDREFEGGWTADDCFGIALYAALSDEDDPLEALIASVWHSGDSDSTGAVCGNILGAAHGLGWMPDSLLDGLVERNVIEMTTSLLLDRYVHAPRARP